MDKDLMNDNTEETQKIDTSNCSIIGNNDLLKSDPIVENAPERDLFKDDIGSNVFKPQKYVTTDLIFTTPFEVEKVQSKDKPSDKHKAPSTALRVSKPTNDDLSALAVVFGLNTMNEIVTYLVEKAKDNLTEEQNIIFNYHKKMQERKKALESND